MRYLPIVVAAMLTLLSNFVYANSTVCYEPSPNLSALGDAYFDLEKTSVLTDEEKNKVNAFFNSLTGNWKGDARTIECRGPDSAPQIKSQDAIMTAQVQMDSTIGLTINANKHYLEQKIKKSDPISLLGKTPVFDFEFSDDNQLTFSERYRRLNKPIDKPKPNATSSRLSTIINKITGNTETESEKTKALEAKRFSRTTETIYNVALNNNQLIISRSYYTNGVFTGADLWALSRE